MLDLVHVRAFVAVAHERHFGRAAARLNMTQPPLSRQIRLLEEHLGQRLFERNAQGVTLTVAGETFLPEAQALLNRAQDITAAMRSRPDRPEGTVRLGFYGAASFALLPALMAEMVAQYPGIRLELHERDAAQQMQDFGFGALDVGLCRPTDLAPGLTARVVLRERLMLALPPGHPLAEAAQVAPEDLSGQDFIAYNAASPYLHALIGGVLARHAVAPRTVQALAHAPSILSLVGVGLGMALVPEHACVALHPGVTFRPFPEDGAGPVVTHLVTRAETRNPLVDLVGGVVAAVGQRLECATRPDNARDGVNAR